MDYTIIKFVDGEMEVWKMRREKNFDLSGRAWDTETYC